jgi:diaminopimelate decarboxylase
LKENGNRHIAVVDTGMHHLIRPALYGAKQFIWPTNVRSGEGPGERRIERDDARLRPYDVVGPICESTDSLASARSLPVLEQGDSLAVFSAGAYGMVMASQYNAVPRPPEVLVDGDTFRIIRRRETYDDLVNPELEFLGP